MGSMNSRDSTRHSCHSTFLAILLITLMSSLYGCSPAIDCDPIHPDIETEIALTAHSGNTGTSIDDLWIEIDGISIPSEVRRDGDSERRVMILGRSSLPPGVGLPSNQRLRFSAVTPGFLGIGTHRKDDWVFVADPKGDFSRPEGTGGNEGYPDSIEEETGRNLYRLDKDIVTTKAIEAVIEYQEWVLEHEGREIIQLPDPDEPVTDDGSGASFTETEILSDLVTADDLVAAVAWYVHKHMGGRYDSDPVCGNIDFMLNCGMSDYAPERGDYPCPADITLSRSGNYSDTPEYCILTNDYMGDCEDGAILRAALLRRLGFRPEYIWCVNDGQEIHEYNIVLYQGAFRIMDHKPIHHYLDDPDSFPYETYYAWNAVHGPRGTSGMNHDYLVEFVDNYPGGRDGNPWRSDVYFREISP